MALSPQIEDQQSEATILVVEDDANLLMGIRDILELENYQIITAKDGQAALARLEEMDDVPDLILSDIMMPNMDGIKLLTQVRQIDRLVSVPFIYLTARGEKTDVQTAKKLGVDDYIIKPFNADDLIIAIQSRLNRARQVQAIHDSREDQLKKSILTILNHEFRTPLTFVMAYSDMLGDMADADTPEDNAEMLTFLEGVRSGADRLRRLIENFVLLVELETGAAQRNYAHRKQKVYNLKPMLEQAAKRAIATQKREEDEFQIQMGEDIPPVIADEVYLGAAVQQLIDNAFKFSSKRQKIQIGIKSTGSRVHIYVRDRGRGIPKIEHENIWESFYQIDRARYEDQGAGSGLTIVKTVAELHGGTVSMKSRPGEGSLFAISLPAAT